MSPLWLLAVAAVAYNVGAGDVGAALRCVLVTAIVWAAFRFAGPQRRAGRVWRHDPEMVDPRPWDWKRDGEA